MENSAIKLGKRFSPRALINARVLALGVLILLGAAPSARIPISNLMPRGFGADIGWELGGTAELDQLGKVWYLDYGYNGKVLPGHPRLFLVQSSEDVKPVTAVARSHRGEWWQFGNEPNDPNQDNLSPSDYARRFHDFYFSLKRTDPGARIVAAGIADADWKWADAFRESYRAQFGRYPHVDGWSIHDYLLDRCEDATDSEKFKARIVAFRNWMTRIGEPDRPLLLTEYGVVYGSGCCECPLIPPAETVAFMETTTRWLIQSRLVQSWAWFSIRSGGRYNGDLFTDQGEPTLYGRAFHRLFAEWVDGLRTP